MKFWVKVFPNAKQNSVIEDAVDIFGERLIKLKVSQPPEDGKANKAAIGLLANYFNVNKSCVKILRGEKSKNKLFEVVR